MRVDLWQFSKAPFLFQDDRVRELEVVCLWLIVKPQIQEAQCGFHPTHEISLFVFFYLCRVSKVVTGV